MKKEEEEEEDTKIKELSLKMQKLQPKNVYSHSGSCNCSEGPPRY